MIPFIDWLLCYSFVHCVRHFTLRMYYIYEFIYKFPKHIHKVGLKFWSCSIFCCCKLLVWNFLEKMCNFIECFPPSWALQHVRYCTRQICVSSPCMATAVDLNHVAWFSWTAFTSFSIIYYSFWCWDILKLVCSVCTMMTVC